MFLAKADLSLPINDPIFIFLLVLVIILCSPALVRFKIPQINFLILAGIVVGPFGLNILSRDASIVLFATVGLIYIIFLTGLELDLTEFRRNRARIFAFGILTFFIPLTIGLATAYYYLQYSFWSSLLLASMFSTHTLVSYPAVRRYGITQNKSVLITIGGTILTDGMALLLLAVIANITGGQSDASTWLRFGLYPTAFILVVYFIYPVIIEWFFLRYRDEVSQFIFILLIVFSASLLAKIAGLEPLLGAFFAGLILNRFVPQASGLKKQIDFVGNALFIPVFLISIGMLVDVHAFFQGTASLKAAGVIIAVALVTKYLAAALTARVFSLSKNEKWLIFGLSSSHAAATLAIILVGYNIIIGESANGTPVRLISDEVLDGTILLILVSCMVSSIVTERAAKRIAAEEEN